LDEANKPGVALAWSSGPGSSKFGVATNSPLCVSSARSASLRWMCLRSY